MTVRLCAIFGKERRESSRRLPFRFALAGVFWSLYYDAQDISEGPQNMPTN